MLDISSWRRMKAKKDNEVPNSSLRRLIERIFVDKKLSQKDQADINLYAKVALGKEEVDLIGQLHERINKGEVKIV